MKKLAVSLLMGSLLLAGAGCVSDTQPTTPAPTNTQSPATNTGTNEQPVSDFTLSGETTENAGEVKLQWSAPANMDLKNKLRIMHSATPGKTVEEGAFWQNLGPSTREYLWTGVKSGRRYFRICELQGDTCINTSNEIIVEVK